MYKLYTKHVTHIVCTWSPVSETLTLDPTSRWYVIRKLSTQTKTSALSAKSRLKQVRFNTLLENGESFLFLVAQRCYCHPKHMLPKVTVANMEHTTGILPIISGDFLSAYSMIFEDRKLNLS